MRIDRLHVQNFKKFANNEFDFHPQFTLLVGDNGSGKTSILDALAVASAVWVVEAPDSRLYGRNILPTEIRLEPDTKGDRIQFHERRPAVVRASGRIGDHREVSWTRATTPKGRTTNAEARRVLDYIAEIYKRDSSGEQVICPVLAYYGAGRAWLPSNQRIPGASESSGAARRWAAFYDCFNERIRFAELNQWFENELIEMGARRGVPRPGFEAVKRAILSCVPEADAISYSSDRKQIVLSIRGNAQPFDNLSAGQAMMLALVADLAIKAVTQNAFLLPPDELRAEDQPLPQVLRQAPGVVLIDELDVHLHPRWQRRVASDLKRTFPAIQFVCTSHSPQVVGELSREEVRHLRDERYELPPVARGADSNWILDHVMEGSSSETPEARRLQDEAEGALADGKLDCARDKLAELRQLLDGETGELARLEGSLHSLEALARAGKNDEFADEDG